MKPTQQRLEPRYQRLREMGLTLALRNAVRLGSTRTRIYACHLDDEEDTVEYWIANGDLPGLDVIDVNGEPQPILRSGFVIEDYLGRAVDVSSVARAAGWPVEELWFSFHSNGKNGSGLDNLLFAW